MQKESPAYTIRHSIFDFIKIFVAFYLFTHIIFQQYQVEGASMSPNLHTDDRLWVDRVSYYFHEARRGDVVVLKYPKDETLNFVKRVIGLPGETVIIKDGRVSIKNAENPEGFILSETYLSPENLTYVVSGMENAVYKVPSDSYFVLGDNRRASSDSREWGFLSKSEIVGRAVLQSYPIDKFSIVSRPEY
jgi:signal peptidase I